MGLTTTKKFKAKASSVRALPKVKIGLWTMAEPVK